MSPRRKLQDRCSGCAMKSHKCICSEIASVRSSIQCKTPVRIIMHYKEARLPTNTGRLANMLLPDSQIWLRGETDDSRDWASDIGSLSNPVYLFPSDEAEVLSPEFFKRQSTIPTLLLPDGNWRQASKVHNRIEGLQNVPHVILPEGARTRYRLRSEPREGGLATFEAIIRYLDMAEGPELATKLQYIFDLMVERTLETRMGR